MCGIVGYVGPKKVVPVIIEGLRRLEYRGYDSAGIAVGSPTHKTLEVRRAPGKLINLEHVLRDHPLHGTYGIVENYLDLKRELTAQGHVFVTETDTEIIAHLIEQIQKDAEANGEAILL